MYKIINVKDFQNCNNNISVAEPRNQAEEVLSKCTSMRTTTFPLIVPGRLRSSMQTTGQSTMCMAMTITFTKDGEAETCIKRKRGHDSANDSGLLSDTDSQTITNYHHN